jgi:ABC transporter DrrB family efflux protein
VEVPSPGEFLPRVVRVPGVLDATPFGQAVHLLVSDALAPGTLLEAVGLTPAQARLRDVPPSLEDVFVALSRAAATEGVAAVAERYAHAARSQTAAPTHAEQVETTHADAANESVAAHDASSAPAAEKGAAASPPGTSTAPLSGRSDDSRRDGPAVSKDEGSSLAASGRRDGRPMTGFVAVLRKEFAHLLRERTTLFFAFLVPVIQLTVFGYAIDTQVELIPTVVFDADGRDDARRLVEAFENTRTFRVTARVLDEESFDRMLTSGRAKVGIRIPADFSDRLMHGEQVAAQVLIDGSDSQVAVNALNAANLLGTQLSIQRARLLAAAAPRVPARDPYGTPALPIEIRPRLLYNPDLDSSHFFVPGLLAIIMQLVTLFLTSFAVVRERERGTLEQLFVTPVGRAALMLGKLCPYALVGFLAMLVGMTVMVHVFGVPIRGSFPLAAGLSLLFLVCGLGLGLLVSTLARTQLEAIQFAFVIMLPSVLLSGFMFPREQMPLPIYAVTFLIPVTYFVEILRGIVLRGADLQDLVPEVLGLLACGAAILTVSIARFRKQLA